MKVLKVLLENCYGIGKLEHTFQFEKSGAHSIYAGNGVMKTSFANTFLRLSKEEQPKELVYNSNSEYEVLADGEAIVPKRICVIQPYQEGYHSERVALLVGNTALREEFEATMADLTVAKGDLISAMIGSSGISVRKKDYLEERLKQDIGVFDTGSDSFFQALERVKGELSDELSQYSGLAYAEIFNDKTEQILKRPEFMEHILSYIENYNNLLEQSHFFKRGVFGPANADDITKELENKGYFKAAHELRLNLAGTSKTIKDKDDLVKFIREEKQQILGDATLEQTFNTLQGMLSKNQDLRRFEGYLSENRQILEELGNQENFKQKLWKSYFLAHKELYDKACDQYAETKETVKRITEEARDSQGRWEEVIGIFNERFTVPFRVTIENKVNVILNDELPAFKFVFHNEPRGASDPMDRDGILEILSQGERRALYLLDVIYEIEGRKQDTPNTLYIVDDIADSFDYKNKYAIIEYLHELHHQNAARLIILSHNFDFYRTVSSRLGISRSCRWHATRNSDNSISMGEEKYQNNPMIDWRKEWAAGAVDDKCLPKIVASVPLMREIGSLTGKSHESLGKALHCGSDSESLTLSEVIAAMREVSGDQASDAPGLSTPWADIVTSAADGISSGAPELALEEKITLSIAIRLHAERFIVNSLNITSDEIRSISRNQTRVLIERFKHSQDDQAQLSLMDKVAIMTPEVIHINSFMYEPLLDISGNHLVDLYRKMKEVLVLNGE